MISSSHWNDFLISLNMIARKPQYTQKCDYFIKMLSIQRKQTGIFIGL